MLTVRYDLLALRPGDLVLDLGCGFGRHAFEAARRGGRVVAFDYADAELKEVRNTFEAMAAAGDVTPGALVGTVQGDGTRIPFPDATFDCVIASEVLEHIADDVACLAELTRVLKPGGVLAATVPAEWPEKVCWWLSDEYHAPKVAGGHVRIYSEDELRTKMAAVGLDPARSHREHALHTPYWWLRCAVGPQNDEHPLVQPYKRLLEWDIVKQPWITRTAERVLAPVLGKSLVVYASKP
jgi:SAM-dependent methyltransferase